MWNKIGITWDSSRRGANAGLLSSDAVFTEAERRMTEGKFDDLAYLVPDYGKGANVTQPKKGGA